MKLTVLGFWGGYPAAGSATSGYLLQKEGFNLLIDCGSGVLAQLQHFIKVEELNAVILSHYHHDHVADIGVLQYGRLIQSYLQKGLSPLPIYGHRQDEKGFASLTYKNLTTGMEYNPLMPLEIGPFTISFLETKHPAVCYAMRVTDGKKTVVYTADSSFQEVFIPFSKNADLLICECNLYKHQDGSAQGHMNSHDAAKIANGADVQQLLLTHLPHFGECEQLAREAKELYNGIIELARTGWTWES
ncbi:MBL fold metallo-hydrolase [Fictibacillus gelatini]|uniref:MBL fold metallo-hydrolase n=1 Tax=Fictibacillus gelatini TaxID=225985 RepID=UPI000404D9AD|nr:MBL fold metallo-hydrolase [Fictibacillus gelatini]